MNDNTQGKPAPQAGSEDNIISAIQITEQELIFLQQIRNYFGEHDKTPFEHLAHYVVSKLIHKVEQSGFHPQSVKMPAPLL